VRGGTKRKNGPQKSYTCRMGVSNRRKRKGPEKKSSGIYQVYTTAACAQVKKIVEYRYGFWPTGKNVISSRAGVPWTFQERGNEDVFLLAGGSEKVGRYATLKTFRDGSTGVIQMSLTGQSVHYGPASRSTNKGRGGEEKKTSSATFI